LLVVADDFGEDVEIAVAELAQPQAFAHHAETLTSRRFSEGVGDRVLEVECLAFAGGGVPCVGSVTCAGRLEERGVEPGIDWVLGLASPRSAAAPGRGS
jgi:hypothetical protein